MEQFFWLHVLRDPVGSVTDSVRINDVRVYEIQSGMCGSTMKQTKPRLTFEEEICCEFGFVCLDANVKRSQLAPTCDRAIQRCG